MKKIILLTILITVFISACSTVIIEDMFQGDSPMGGSWRIGNYSSNGERIYFTASNESGERIPYSGGPAFGGMMMGTQATCASCHGSDGRGGDHWMHMELMDAPDIRLEALLGEAEEHGEAADDHDDDHADAHEGYDLETFEKAVVFGQHPDGDPLDNDMPRWRLSEKDLRDLFDFLMTLD